ncbi:probable crossover junction endonuclease EME2 [Spea bombifrons]|uniref:probable crossover junction endonuclease EME2 n=1 Tax=Spea bombifrons TaxID=233779 RepID=UPI00234ACAFC|nr:probable crossover junction endonuclease EME2 [Spea bombifrons]
MEGEQKKSIASSGAGLSPNKLAKRATTWEISDSENEEESGIPQQEEKKSLVIEIETTEFPTDVKESSPRVVENASALVVPEPGGTTPSPIKRMRKKKTPEELVVEKVQAEERQRERELKKQEKEKRKAQEKLEKERRKEAASALKMLRPDQCVKYMTVSMDAGLLEDAGSEDVLEALRSSGYQYSIEPHSVPKSFTWRRDMPVDWTCIEGLELRLGEEDEMLVLVQSKDFLASVSCFAQAVKYSSIGDQDEEALGSLFGISKRHQEKKTTMVVIGLQEYRWCQKLSRRMERQSLEQNDNICESQSESNATKKQIQEAFVFLQLSFEMEVLCLDSWKELGKHVCAVTKSLAQRPFRKHWDDQTFSFCTSAGSWKGWGPRGTLTGLPLSWRRQIQQFNRVSPAMAAAVTEAYPSPQLLMKAYAECATEREKMALLSNLHVLPERNAGDADEAEGSDAPHGDHQPQGRERRIGPDLSRRIWLFMTSPNPEQVLDLNS